MPASAAKEVMSARPERMMSLERTTKRADATSAPPRTSEQEVVPRPVEQRERESADALAHRLTFLPFPSLPPGASQSRSRRT